MSFCNHLELVDTLTSPPLHPLDDVQNVVVCPLISENCFANQPNHGDLSVSSRAACVVTERDSFSNIRPIGHHCSKRPFPFCKSLLFCDFPLNNI